VLYRSHALGNPTTGVGLRLGFDTSRLFPLVFNFRFLFVRAFRFTPPLYRIASDASKTSLLSNQCRQVIGMELRHLRYVVAVGEEQHYGRGAKRLRVAQPALSWQIQELEEEIGFKLFDRLSRGVKVSAAGKVFLEDARRVLQQRKRTSRRMML
jgi:hypothetical protein